MGPLSYSVVIPAYNVEPWIAGCIASCLHQTVRAEEIIVVDDGSTDATWECVMTIAREHPDQIRAVQQENAGSQAARNAGLRMASGSWIQFLDADDELFPQKVERQLRLGEEASAGVVAGSFYRGKERAETLQRGEPHVAGLEEDPWVNLFRSRCGITSAILWRKEVVESVGGWNPLQSSSQEYELMFRIMKEGHLFAFDAVPATYARAREQSISGNFGCHQRVNHGRLRLEMLQYLEREGHLHGYRRKAMRKGFMKYIRGLSECDLDLAAELHDTLTPRFTNPIDRDPFSLLSSVLGFRKTLAAWAVFRESSNKHS